MITAIIRNKENTLVLELPHSIYGIYEKLQSIGIRQPPKQIPLTDNEDEDIGVKLFSESAFGQHLLLTLNEKNSIADANMLTLVIGAASEDIKEELEQNILYDQYGSMDEVINAIRQMTQDAGPVKAVFFCPLIGNIDEGDGDMFTVGDSYLADSADEISDALKEYTANDENATTTFTMGSENVKVRATYKDADPSHTHTYGTEWKSDADNHWHECDCGAKADLAAHTLSDWIIDTAATATADGAKHKECTVCHKVLETETIPATGSSHTHAYGETWKSDADNHWHECECGDKADLAAHSFSWKIDREATKTETGLKHEECSVCGAKRNENTVIDKLPDGGSTNPGGNTGDNTGNGGNNTNKPAKDDSTKSPQTGDTSTIGLWIALLFVSGGIVFGAGLYGKKRKES